MGNCWMVLWSSPVTADDSPIAASVPALENESTSSNACAGESEKAPVVGVMPKEFMSISIDFKISEFVILFS